MNQRIQSWALMKSTLWGRNTMGPEVCGNPSCSLLWDPVSSAKDAPPFRVLGALLCDITLRKLSSVTYLMEQIFSIAEQRIDQSRATTKASG